MKHLAIGLIFILCAHCLFSQSNDSKYHVNCESAVFDSIKVKEHYVKYKMLSKIKTPHASNENTNYEGEALIPNWKDVRGEIEMIANEISKKHLLKELNVFHDCKAREIYYQALKRLPEQEEYLKENYRRIYRLD